MADKRWKCPMCGEINTASSARCVCGYEENEENSDLNQKQAKFTNQEQTHELNNNSDTDKKWAEFTKQEEVHILNRDYESTYKTARGIATLVSFIGWFLVAIGVIIAIVALIGLSNSNNLSSMAFIPAISLIVGGLLLVMGGQLNLACVDTADNTGRLVELIAKQQIANKKK